MQRVKQKADQSKEQRENIELPEEKVSVRGEPIPFKVRSNVIETFLTRNYSSFLFLGLYSNGRGHPVQKGDKLQLNHQYFQHVIMNIQLIAGSEGWRRAPDLQGNQAEQPHHAQLQTHNR